MAYLQTWSSPGWAPSPCGSPCPHPASPLSAHGGWETGTWRMKGWKMGGKLFSSVLPLPTWSNGFLWITSFPHTVKKTLPQASGLASKKKNCCHKEVKVQQVIRLGSLLKQTTLMKAGAADRRWRSVCQLGCRPFCNAAALDRGGGDSRECGGSRVELSRPVMVCDFLQTDTGP